MSAEIVGELPIAGTEMIERMAIGAEKQEIFSRIMIPIPIQMVNFKNSRFHVPSTAFADAVCLFQQQCLRLLPITNTSRLPSLLSSQVLQVPASTTILGLMVAKSDIISTTEFAPSSFPWHRLALRTCPRAMRSIRVRTDSTELLPASRAVQSHTGKMKTFCHRRTLHATHA